MRAAPKPASIRATLALWLAAGLSVALAAAAVLTYLRARDEANDLFDVQLRQTAASITGMPIAGTGPLSGAYGEEGLVVQIWDGRGVRVFRSQAPDADDARIPGRAAPGFATIDTPSGPYRVFSVVAAGQLVQVGQPLAVRNQLAAKLAASTVLPLLVIAPLIGLLVWVALQRGLAPLTRVAAAVQKRNPSQLAPLAGTGWPSEVVPLVEALNGLLGRLDRALAAQRALVADAAHELRSPLAALGLQAQLAQRAGDPTERDRALAELRGGLQRATRMVEQLLALARQEPGVVERPFAPVALAALARDTVAALAPLAAAKAIDLGLERADDVLVQGDADALATLLANLVDNAIRYTPAGGRVDVLVEEAPPRLVVLDDGPGVPAHARERLFERFARGDEASAPGSGLGLAIVKRIAERHGARVTLGDGIGGRGCGVTVDFAPAGGLSRESAAGGPAPPA
ncbi:MAG TPA: ATP-binding protein [Casimicrobiaceae bacterium]|nr:ATP-binding protein [Casimicrobiaceae bacterium]